MQLPIVLDPGNPAPLQLQLLASIRELILTNCLRPGSRLPASRELSAQLGISRNTILHAYDRLIAEGYLQTHPKAGTFVTRSLPEDSLLLRAVSPPTPERALEHSLRRPVPRRYRAPLLYERPRHRLAFDFRIGRPDAHSFPLKTWRRLVDENLASAGSKMTQYSNPAGTYELRRAIADHLGPARGITASPDQVIIVGGCEEGLNIIGKVLVRDGTEVCVETPCYQGVAFVFESYGGNMIPVPVDGEGIDVGALPRRPVSLVCVTPSHQFPLGVTMSLNRRLRLLDWARGAGAYVLEDDYDSDFRYDGSPMTALQGLDRDGCVIYVGTFSKSIGAALRIGYLVVPPDLVGPAREAKALLDNGNPWLDQVVLAEFLGSGSFSSHLRRIRHTYQARRDCLIASLRKHFGDTTILGQEGGMHLTWMLPEGSIKARNLQNLALDLDVGIYTVDEGPAFDYDRFAARDRAIFLGYPSLSEKQIREGIRRLASILRPGARGSPSGT
ncbi:MAG: PLP-dependent aminotransferase family protein [Gammaproteobacteria bacterium]